jgi:hypothetical protein
VHVYRVLPDAASVTGNGEVPGDGSLMVAVRPGDLASPLRGRIPGGGDRSALVIGGTAQVRTGEPLVFCKVVVVAPAQVRRDGQVQAQGSPLDHATLGPLEEWLEEKAGPEVIGGIAEKAVLRKEFVKGERERLLAAAFMIRVIVLMTLMPGADIREAATVLAGDLAGVPWSRRWVPASPRACSGTGGTRSARGRWRNCRPWCCAPRTASTRSGAGGR